MKTREEVEELKREWAADGSWDLEETDGFEAHREELAAFAREHSARRELAWRDRVAARSTKLACSFELADYIIRLEQRLDAFATDIERALNRNR